MFQFRPRHVAYLVAYCLLACSVYAQSCNPGFTGLFSVVNVARACNADRNEACTATASGVHRFSLITFGNDNNWNTFFEADFGTNLKHWYRLNLQAERDIVSIIFHNRANGGYRSYGAEVRVGSSATWQQNAVCTTLDSTLTQSLNCVATGQYIFIVAASGVQTLNFVELEVFGLAETFDSSGVRICTQCATGSFKSQTGYEACSKCPEGSFSLQFGSTDVSSCTCTAGFTGNGGLACTPCAAGTLKAAAGDSACTPYTCPADTFSPDVKASVTEACTVCPLRTVSLPGSNALTGCQCQSGTYEQLRVLNPVYAQRSYSSSSREDWINSMLDDQFYETVWTAGINNNAQWMSIDAGQPMYIVGVFTQARGTALHDMVKSFTVDHALFSTSGSSTLLPGTFQCPDGHTCESLFSRPVYARYIRINVKTWNVHVSMRAGLLVKSCTSCFSNSMSVRGSLAVTACACPQGLYRYSSTHDIRALALVPGSAQLSTLANRVRRHYVATAQFDSTAGPSSSKGAVTFARATGQYLDGGSHNFNIEFYGFTAIIVVIFTGVPLNNERIFDFGSAVSNNNIALWRHGTTNQLNFGIWNGDSACMVSLPNAIQQNSWLTIVATYDSISTSLKLTIGASTNSFECTARTNRHVVNTFIGRSFFVHTFQTNIFILNSLSGSIAGLYAVDASLTNPEIDAVLSRINTGEDTLQTCSLCLAGSYFTNGACEACPVASTSPEDSTSIMNCVCTAGFTGPAGGPCAQCVPNTFKAGTSSQTCSFCPSNAISRAGSIVHTACKCNSGYAGANGGVCTQCAANTFKLLAGPQPCANCPLNSNAPVASIFATACACNPGYTGINGSLCTLCAPGTFKTASGSAVCSICPAGSFSLEGSTSINNCVCIAGFTGSGGSDCTACVPGTFKAVSGNVACALYTCPVNQFSSETPANIAATCFGCPSNTVSIAGSTTPTACQCRAGTYEEIHILNPVYSQRTYSSAAGPEIYSLLDDRHLTSTWRSAVNFNGQWMRINAGTPMFIAGLITQGPLLQNDWIRAYSVQYDTPEPSVTFPNAFTRANSVVKSQELFPAPVYAQTIQMTVTSFHNSNRMRAALVVKSCSSCFASSTSAQNSASLAACACPQGLFRYSSTLDVRALALVPGRAQLSTLANRGLRNYAATAQFSSTAGPLGSKGAVTFHSATSQYLDGTSHQFDIAFHGFTAVMIVIFTGSPVNDERILDFGNGAGSNTISMRRTATSSQLQFHISNANSDCVVLLPNVINQGSWLTIVAQYNSIDFSMQLRVGQFTNSAQCTARINRNAPITSVGTAATGGAYMSGSIAGLYAVDAFMTELEIQAVVSRISAGEDVLQTCSTCLPGTYFMNGACAACPPASSSLQGATSITDCMCTTGFTGTNGGPCAQCASGTFKSATGSAPCSFCPTDMISPAGSTSETMCVCVAGEYHDRSNTRCASCPANSYSPMGSDSESDCVCDDGMLEGAAGSPFCVPMCSTGFHAVDIAQTCGHYKSAPCAATQASTLPNFAASNALDNNIATFMQTTGVLNPWWQVVLQQARLISHIKIAVRQDCCEERQDRITITIDGQICVTERPQLSRTGWHNVQCDQSLTGGTVNISAPDMSMALAEVQVWSCTQDECPVGSNVVKMAHACGFDGSSTCVATQSTQHTTFGPHLVLDTDVNTWNHLNGANGWWQISLARQVAVSSLDVAVRQDCCADRQDNYVITVDGALCISNQPRLPEIVGFINVQCAADVTGSVVRFAAPNPWFALSEVEVNACVPDCAPGALLDLSGPGCTSCAPGSFTVNYAELNPPEWARTYSNMLPNHQHSRLDSELGAMAWCAANVSPVMAAASLAWIEIDAGKSMMIAGIVTQGRQNGQCVKRFRVEYRNEFPRNGIAIAGEFFATSTCVAPELLLGGCCTGKKRHLFPRHVRARYVRIFALDFNNHLCMRAGLVAYVAPKFKKVLNPPEFARTYSSIHGGTLRNSMLDTIVVSNAAWCAATNVAGHFMEIDAGAPMHILGVVIQGRNTNQQVSIFTVQYALANEARSDLGEIFAGAARNNDKREFLFTSHVYARYIRIIVLDWEGHVCMRAALVVSTCEMCTGGLYSSPGSTSEAACTSECGSGFYSTPSDQSPISPNMTSNICTQCPPNSDVAAGSNNWTECACNVGFSGPNGGTCHACVAGTYKNSTGDAPCTDCAAEQYSTVVAATSNVCQTCVADSFSLQASDQETDCMCNSGYTRGNAGPCQTCVAGKFKIEIGNVPCTNCVIGKYSTAVAAVSDVCEMCATDSNSVQGSDEKTDCLCNLGYVGNNGGPCEPCIAGKFKVAIGDGTCSNCVAGTYKLTPGSGICTNCPITTYSTSVAATTYVCLSCPALSNSAVASNELTDCICNTGSTGPHGSACTQCAAGTFKTSTGSAACTNCSVNTYSSIEGAVSNVCQACPVLSHAAVASTALANCTCNAGSTGPQGGACVQCVPGTYKSVVGSAACTNCPKAGYDSGVGSTSVDHCFICAVGFYSPGPGQACLACALGTYKDTIGSSLCLLCPVNSIAPLIGSIACMPCENSFTAGDSRNICSCNAGYVDNRNFGPDLAGWIGQYYHFQGVMDGVNYKGFDALTPQLTKRDFTINYFPKHTFPWSAGQFAARWQGIIRITTAGVYTFHTNCDDGSFLWINENLVVDNGGHHAMTVRTGTAHLSVGDHFARVHFWESGGAAGMIVHYTGPGISGWQLLPAISRSSIACVECGVTTALGCSTCATERVDSCFQCPAGSFKDKEDDWRCTLCPAGKYTATIGNVECSICPANSNSPQGSVSESHCLCIAGYIAVDGNSPLNSMSYSGFDGGVLCVQVCPLGMKATGNQTTCAPYETNYIINVTDDYRDIFKSSNRTVTGLLSVATARRLFNTTLAINAVTREETMWQHITNQTTRSCQDLVSVIAAIPDIQNQYMQAVRLLKHDGPCAPGFTGYDLLQDPGNAEFVDSECILLATTAENTRRDALLVVQRHYIGRTMYYYSAQYLTPALVRRVFASDVPNGVQESFCNVRNREQSPAAFETVLSRVWLWTLPQGFAVVDVNTTIGMAQIRQNVKCA